MALGLKCSINLIKALKPVVVQSVKWASENMMTRPFSNSIPRLTLWVVASNRSCNSSWRFAFSALALSIYSLLFSTL